MSYPTLRRIRRNRWESEEQFDGIPDYVVERDWPGPLGVWVKQRTSGKLTRFNTIAEAVEYIRVFR